MNFSVLIQNWFDENKRDLPWRRTQDPYKIWLSEIILQQTRVDQGMAYYLKFIDHYPTVSDLAAASEDEVLNDWQGLGYYSRARNLHAAAKYIVDELDGKFPSTHKGVLALKGVGDYTAAAICSIAYNLPYAVVDGNVYRVLSRYLEISTPIDSTKGKKEFAVAANELLDPSNPSDHNQGLMEIGALVCTPTNPKCDACPVHETCATFQKGTQSSFPVKSKKLKVRKRYLNYLVLHKDEKILIKKRGGGDIWKGLYDFPLIERETPYNIEGTHLKEYEVEDFEMDVELKHILTHQHLMAKFWWCEVKEHVLADEYQLINKKELEDYPLPQMLIRYIQSSKHFSAD